MGNYLNPDINNFMEVVNSSIYVDKTELLEYLNSIAQTTQKYICISRPRRFGKARGTFQSGCRLGCPSRTPGSLH